MTNTRHRTAAATAAVRRKRQERLARDLIAHGWMVFAPEDWKTPWEDSGDRSMTFRELRESVLKERKEDEES